MSIYDKASLVLIPSGTKTSKVYSQKPTNGDGDFTFSRSTAATRVNASGNIEKETQNLLLQSNTFSNASWTLTSAAVTGGHSGYDGTNTAWELLSTAASCRASQTISTSGVQTMSVYAKAGSVNWMALYVVATAPPYVYFDLANGVLGGIQNNVIDASMEDMGGGWYRCSIAFNKTATEARIFTATANGILTTTSGDSIYIQDAQLNQGLIAQEVITTTTTAIYGGITDNVPRLDYTDSSCPALLLEPQRTNKIGNSEFINNDSSWYEANGADCTPNYALSPEGVNNATRVQLDNSGAFSLTRIYHDFVPDASNDTASFYAKSNTGSSFDIVIYFRDSGFGAVRGSKTITITNEWQRFDLTADCSGAAGNVMFLIYNTTASENWDFLMYGAQIEAGSYATSYIPTYGSAVTRNAEACNSAGTSATFNDSEGVLFVELEALAEDSTYRFISVSDGTSTNRINILLNNNNTLRAFVAGVGSLISSVDITQNNKAAIKYKSGDYAFWVNGTEVATNTSTSGTHTGLNELAFDMGDGSNDFYGKTKQVLYIPTALTDAELEDLTTL